MQNCCSYNYYCTTIVFTPLSAEEEQKKKYYLIEMSWVRDTDRKKRLVLLNFLSTLSTGSSLSLSSYHAQD